MLSGDVVECAAVSFTNGIKIDTLGTSIKECAETIVQAVAANGEKIANASIVSKDQNITLFTHKLELAKVQLKNYEKMRDSLRFILEKAA